MTTRKPLKPDARPRSPRVSTTTDTPVRAMRKPRVAELPGKPSGSSRAAPRPMPTSAMPSETRPTKALGRRRRGRGGGAGAIGRGGAGGVGRPPYGPVCPAGRRATVGAGLGAAVGTRLATGVRRRGGLGRGARHRRRGVHGGGGGHGLSWRGRGGAERRRGRGGAVGRGRGGAVGRRRGGHAAVAGLRRARAAPAQHEPGDRGDRDQPQRGEPAVAVADREDATEHEERGEHEQRDRPGIALAHGPLGEDVALPVGQEQPEDHVRGQADAAEEGEHDRRGPDQHRVDAEALGQAGADTAEPAAVGVAVVAAAAQPGEAVVEE